ncbi:hypothetical protein CRE_19061 [Caenorhabditis remanei]|uniref:Uncharacterized protein n=1 Tax=Caenorhabditis remanei TaxID=31234 RepID=E3LLJ7_CAERE|nr:hypothetical protein CRE_19061 [Caenorhabditis remanei]
MDKHWVYQYVPKVFCILAFIVNPVFVYLIFSEKSSRFGYYRFLLLYFAIFNLIYSVMNVVVPLVSEPFLRGFDFFIKDIHSYGYCFYLILSDGWFVELSTFNTHILTVRCSLVACSYAVLTSHFMYRYLVIHNSTWTRENFHWFLTASFLLLVLYFGSWYSICFILGRVNVEIRKYIREEFQVTYGKDSMNFNMIGALFQIIRKLNKATMNLSRKTSKFQFELFRALIIQTTIPIIISFSPSVNYFEVSALGLFAFVDPVAIILCIPIFRTRVFCNTTAK